jgi:GNAT superfamily N-acetyltransferase
VSETARRAEHDDLDELERLSAEADAQLRGQRGGELWALTVGRRPPVRESLAASMDDVGQCCVVGCIDDVVVGFGVVRRTPLADDRAIGVVDELFVTSEAREVGVGEAMMDLLVAWCREQGCIGIDAVAMPGDRATKNFFETFGLTARAILVHRTLEDGEAG